MQQEEKVRFIDEVFDFMMDEPFGETASHFPSPEDVIETWFFSAIIFRNLRDSQGIPPDHYEALHTLISEAEAEYWAAKMMGEPPDTEEEMGLGYDDDEIPEGFAAKYQQAIWAEVIKVLDQDKRPREWEMEFE